MIILSLFDGISACRLAAERAGIKVDWYIRAEIDRFANIVSNYHYPDSINMGDVTRWREWQIDWSRIDIVTAGFPCQAWSVAGQQMGDKDPRGALFWTTLEIFSEVLKHNPKAKFLMENVKMKHDFEQYITRHTELALGGVTKTLIDSALVSAQRRQRYYWTNFNVTQPDDLGYKLRDILDTALDHLFALSADAVSRFKPCAVTPTGQIGTTAHDGSIGYSADSKSPALTATMYKQPIQYALDAAKLSADLKSGVITADQNLTGESQSRHRAVANYKTPDDKANTLTACSFKGMQTNGMTNVLVYKVNDNKRVVGITENERGYRPHRGDAASTGISELGRILKPTACATDTVTTTHAPKVALNSNIADLHFRKVTPLECARLQTFPDGWCESVVSNTQAYKCYGNAWTVDVVAHIFRCMLNETA